MRRLRPIPTIIVALAIAAMVALGVWQLRRAEWKDAMIARFAEAQHRPAIAWPAIPRPGDELLFRRAEGFCLEVTGWATRAGRNRAGQTGWRHIAACRTGAEGPGMQVDMGWSQDPKVHPRWRGGPVRGVIEGDRDHLILLVSDRAAPGFAASAPPSVADLPNNHRGYAMQWFLFAATALIIYLIAALRGAKQRPG